MQHYMCSIVDIALHMHHRISSTIHAVLTHLKKRMESCALQATKPLSASSALSFPPDLPLVPLRWAVKTSTGRRFTNPRSLWLCEGGRNERKGSCGGTVVQE